VSAAPAIALRGVSKRYSSGAPAVDGVAFDVAAGSLTALIGGSGAGKTTTLKCVNRLVEPDAGEVLIEGRRNDAVPAPTLRRGIGYVFQTIGLFPHLSVADKIAVTPGLLGWPAA
jgi:osmoprotectant transport system ATP-binding protein